MNSDLLGLLVSRQISLSLEMHFPYVFTRNEAFPLKTFLIKPYPRSCMVTRSVLLIIESAEQEGC